MARVRSWWDGRTIDRSSLQPDSETRGRVSGQRRRDSACTTCSLVRRAALGGAGDGIPRPDRRPGDVARQPARRHLPGDPALAVGWAQSRGVGAARNRLAARQPGLDGPGRVETPFGDWHRAVSETSLMPGKLATHYLEALRRSCLEAGNVYAKCCRWE